ncbi:hypothetical protein [Bradyrhizobium sp. ARR65]|uniref:hypothetical protein n=1 Tax=Bradyrhizobium sp. ARR65 TaxID=1040989 RepID=UPI0012FCCF42|nr:hypothetical protein [Bradyrhizobium sp. ARR65]
MFNGRLFEIAPAVKPLLRSDMTEQRCKLMATPGALVNSLGNLEAELPAASTLVKRHVDYGVKAADYTPLARRCCGRWSRVQDYDDGVRSSSLATVAAACLCEEIAQRALGRYADAVICEEPRLADAIIVCCFRRC